MRATSAEPVRVRAEWRPHSGGQAEILESDARFRIIACGRRWGKTTLAAREAARYLGRPDTLVWWVAPTYDEADRGFKAVREALPEAFIEKARNSWPKAYHLVNGATIEFRSTERENSNRGEGLDLIILDEADGIRDAAWHEDLRPSLSDTGGDMIAISTPMRKGWFHRWFQRGQSPDHPEVESWQFPTSANPHIPPKEIDAARLELPERSFRQEYEAAFIAETGGVFTNLDEHLFTEDYDLKEAEGREPFVHFWDLARHQDWTVGITLDDDGRVVNFVRLRDVGWPTIQTRIEVNAEAYPGVVGIDATRDNKIMADLEAEGLDVEPVVFTAQRKREMVESLAAALEAGELTAPDIPELRTELEVFEYDVTPAGNVRYGAPEGFHDDCVDALAGATWLWTARRRIHLPDDLGWGT